MLGLFIECGRCNDCQTQTGMANIKSAEKRNRQNQKRYIRNRTLRSSARTAIKKARLSIETGSEDAIERVRIATKALDKAASKGAIHQNNASRRKGRLAMALNKMEAA